MSEGIEAGLIHYLHEIGGAFKFGRGLLGKSAIPLLALMVAVIVAAFRIHSDEWIVLALVLAAVIFFLWYFLLLRFCEKHPDVALLEGGEWTSYKRFEQESRGLALGLGDTNQVNPQHDLAGMSKPEDKRPGEQ